MRTMRFANVALSKHAVARVAVALGILVAECAGSTDMTSLSPDENGLKWFECGGGNVWPKGCDAYLVWGDYEKGPSGWYIRAPAGYLFPRHLHSTEERILLVRGKMTGGVDRSSEATVMPGGYWSLEGNAVHWARCEEACLMYITYDKPFDLAFK